MVEKGSKLRASLSDAQNCLRHGTHSFQIGMLEDQLRLNDNGFVLKHTSSQNKFSMGKSMEPLQKLRKRRNIAARPM